MKKEQFKKRKIEIWKNGLVQFMMAIGIIAIALMAVFVSTLFMNIEERWIVYNAMYVCVPLSISTTCGIVGLLGIYRCVKAYETIFLTTSIKKHSGDAVL